jgi:hypothetical protein
MGRCGRLLGGRRGVGNVPIEIEIRPLVMGKLLSFVGATIGGYAGWFAGAKIGFTTAFMLSMVGTGIGMYYGRLIARNYGA